MEDGARLSVSYVGIVVTSPSLSVEVRYRSEHSSLESAGARQEREELLRYICGHFPEYKEAFDGVFVGSLTSWGKGYREYFPFEREPGKSNQDATGQMKK